MFIICTIDEAYNLPDHLFNNFYYGKVCTLELYNKLTTRVVISTYNKQYNASIVAKGYEPTGSDVFKYSDEEAQNKLLEIMLCG